MSMLSAQVDKLREVADEASKLECTDRVSVPWMRNKLVPMLREAADTILSLRDKAQELQAENIRLRAERDHMWALRDTWQENDAKLRELARGLGQCAQGVDCEDCLLYDLSEPDHCREERLSHELGIEVG